MTTRSIHRSAHTPPSKPSGQPPDPRPQPAPQPKQLSFKELKQKLIAGFDWDDASLEKGPLRACLQGLWERGVTKQLYAIENDDATSDNPLKDTDLDPAAMRALIARTSCSEAEIRAAFATITPHERERCLQKGMPLMNLAATKAAYRLRNPHSKL